MERIADFILKNRRPVLVVAVLLALATIYPALNIQADFSLEGFFPEDDPTIERYQRFYEEYGRDDNIIVIGLEDENLFSGSTLTDIKKLAGALREIDNVTSVRSLWDAQKLMERDGSLSAESFLVDPVEELDFAEIKSQMLDSPFVERILLSKSGAFTIISIEIDEEKNTFPVREQVIGDMREIINPYKSQYDLYVAGIPYFRNQYVHLLNYEIIFYISISSVLIILLLFFLFRNVQGVVIPILIVWLTILLTLSVLYWSGGYFEILTSSIAPILLCVGIADSVHMLSKYNDERIAGKTRGKSLRESLIVLGSATFMTSITTAVGFATLITSNVIPMRTFGLYTAIGVLIAFVITIFLLPSLMPLFKNGDPMHTRSGKIHEGVGRFLGGVFAVSQKHHKVIVIGTLLLTIGIGLGITQLRVNGYVFDDVGRDSPLVQESNIISERLSPQFPLEIIIDTGEENGITDPELLKRVEELQTWLTGFDELEKSLSMADLMREVHAVMNPDEAVTTPIPDRRDLIAQYILLLEITDDSVLEQVTDFEYSQIRISTQTYDVGSWRINQIREELDNYFAQHFPDESVLTTGTTILVADLTDNIVFSLASSIMLAFLFISIIMARLFKNIRLVLISLLPNLMPIIVVAGVMGYFGIDIKPSTAVIFTIAFGIAVDDSIHFLARFRIETRRGLSLQNAIRVTTERTGRAIILTSLILVVGFGTLGFSDFESTMLMGRLVCLTILIALIADLFFLPALIYWIKPELSIRPEHRKPAAKSARESVPEFV